MSNENLTVICCECGLIMRKAKDVTRSRVSHSICVPCLSKLYPEYFPAAGEGGPALPFQPALA